MIAMERGLKIGSRRSAMRAGPTSRDCIKCKSEFSGEKAAGQPVSTARSRQCRDHDREPLLVSCRSELRLEAGELPAHLLLNLLDLLNRVLPIWDAVEMEPPHLPFDGPVFLDCPHRFIDHPLQQPENREAIRDFVRVLKSVPNL